MKNMKAVSTNRYFTKVLFLATILFACATFSFAQPVLPQRTISVTPTQNIHFGTVCVTGSGGTVTVGFDGSRTATGGVTLLAVSPSAQPAIFEIKLCQGRSVIISFDATTTLTGSEGGSLTMLIGPTEKGINGASFLTNADCSFITPLRVGGTLNIPGAAIPGIYSGSFAITFNQE